MKKQNQLIKKILVNVLVGSLIHVQTFNVVYAQSTVQDMKNAIDIVGGAASQILGTKAQMINSQIGQAQMQSLQQQLAPKTAPSKYFPECQLPMAMSNFPQNACQVSTNPNQVSQMFAYETMSNQLTNYFDQMLNEATMNSSTGIKCLTDKNKMLDSQLTEMINNITRLQTQLKQESETFREGNKALLANLENTNSELFGVQDSGSGGNNVNAKSRDFSKIVSPSCQNVIGKDAMSNATKGGFNGLLTSTQAKNKSANDFNLSKGQIESEIRNEVQSLKNSIASNGVDNWANPNDPSYINNALSNGTSYPSLISSVQKDVASLNSQKQRIASEMRKIYPNYSLPPMNQNSSADLQNFINGSQDYFKKEYINNCATDSSYGVAIDINKVIDSVQQKSTNNSQAAISAYKQALQNILGNSSMLISDKLSQIKALESTYPGITITYTAGNGATTSDSPYGLISNTVASCTAKFSQDQSFAKSGSQGVSEKTKATRATALLQEYKNLGDSFANNLGNDIINTVLNCSGESQKATDSCDESTVDAKAKGFCMTKAATCANAITNCYTEINTQIDKRKADMAKMALQYNANVQTMVNRANALYTSQQKNITGLLQNLQSRFPGTNFEIPTDMYIKLPELSKDKYGVDMAGNGDINSFIEDLPSKMDKLKEMFAKQKQAADSEITDYIGKQKTAMTTEKERWKSLARECKSAADASAQQIADLNKKGQEAAHEMKIFCKKYDNLRSNPTPACDVAKSLATDVSKATNSASDAAIDLIENYNVTCSSLNNEGAVSSIPCEQQADKNTAKYEQCVAKQAAQNISTGSNKKENSVSLDIADKCNIKGNGTPRTNEEFINALVNDSKLKASADYKKDDFKKKLSDAIKEGTDFSTILNKDDKSPFASVLDNLPDFTNSNYYCKSLKEKMESSFEANSPTNSLLDQTLKDKENLVAQALAEKEVADSKLNNAKKAISDNDKIINSKDAPDATKKDASEKSKLLNDNKDAAEKVASEAKVKYNNANAEKTAAALALENKKEAATKPYLESLKISISPNTPATLNPQDEKNALLAERINKIRQVGEQSQSSCDSNNNLAFGKMPYSLAPPTLDPSILGANGANR